MNINKIKLKKNFINIKKSTNLIISPLDIFNEDDVSYHPMEKELYANLDKTQLIRIVTNLIKNATQAVEEKETPIIDVKVYCKEDKIFIEVSDNGKGIKEEVDEERGVKYNYFAINGLEKGAVIEKIFVLEESPELNGKTFRMQDDLPIMDINFELIHPNHLVFKTKGYNNLSGAVIDDKIFKDKIQSTEQNLRVD